MKSVFRNANGIIVQTVDGKWSPLEADFEDPVRDGITVEHVLEASDVRAEASRRMMLMVGARDTDHLDDILSNGAREAIRLIKGRLLTTGIEKWSDEDEARAAELVNFDLMIDAIRAASNAIEDDPPIDYADDKHWP